MRAILNKTSKSYERVTSGGFTIDPDIFLNKIDSKEYLIVSAFFTCVCGRIERVSFHTDKPGFPPSKWMELKGDNLLVDVAKVIEDIGANSVKHLRNDGYTEEQIKQIRKPYDVVIPEVY